MIYTKGCQIKTVTRASDINGSDLRVIAGTPVANGANWDIPISIKVKPISDIKNFVQVTTSAQLSHSGTPGPILVGPLAAGAPNELNFTFTNIAMVPANTGNQWRINLNGLRVVGKGGQTVTAATQVVVFVDSPF